MNKYSILLAVACAFFLALLIREREKSRATEKAYIASKEQAVFWKDKHDRSNAERVVLKTSLDLLKKTDEKIIDSLKSLKIKPHTVTRMETVTLHTSDTIYFRSNRPVTSRWHSFQLDSNRLVYSIRDSISLITHTKRYGFLNLKSKYVTRVVSFNPNTILTGLTSTEIVPRRRRLSIGAYGGYGLTVSGGSVFAGPQLGIGINYKLF